MHADAGQTGLIKAEELPCWKILTLPGPNKVNMQDRVLAETNHFVHLSVSALPDIGFKSRLVALGLPASTSVVGTM